jgi:hypothetical protein
LPLIARATTARPADRFSTSLDFVGALQDALSGSRPRTSAAVADVDEEPRRVREARARRGTHDLLLPLDADAIDEPSVPPAAPFVDIEHDIRVPEAPAPEPAAFRDSTDALAHLEIDADRTDIAQRPDAIDLPGIEDGVAPDEWVAYEYAKIRRFYAQLGIADRTEIEFFNGPHMIHGVGTYHFLHKHLNWPEP